MTKSKLEIKELGIVLIGKFNPIIYHPQWMARKDILSPSEADAANVKINHPEVSEFELDYCTVQVVGGRFSATSTQETHFKSMRDLVVNICEHLPECPVAQLGINLHHHFKFHDQDSYDAFGHKVLPKEPMWKQFLEDPKLSNVAIQGKRTDGLDGYKTVHINISGKVRPFGVQMYVNDHYQLYPPEKAEEMDARKAIEVLNEHVSHSLEQSGTILNGIYDYGIS